MNNIIDRIFLALGFIRISKMERVKTLIQLHLNDAELYQACKDEDWKLAGSIVRKMGCVRDLFIDMERMLFEGRSIDEQNRAN